MKQAETRDESAAAPAAALPAGTARRDAILLGGLALLFLGGLAGLAAVTGWEETTRQLARLGPAEMAALLGLSLVNYLLRGVRWHVYAGRLGLGTTLMQDLRHFLGGFAMTVTPGRVGELVRMRWIRRETGWPLERTAPLVLVDRAADLAAMGLMLGAALAFSATGIAGAVPVALLAVAVAVTVTRPRLFRWAVTRAWKLLGLWPRIFGRIRRAALSLDRFTAAPVALRALALGLVGWAAEGYAFYLLLVWMGADTGFWTATAIFIFATLAGGATGAPGGLGGAEAAMIALLSLEGIPLEVSLPATAIIRVTTLWFAIGIGMAVFPLAEAHARRGAHALEPR